MLVNSWYYARRLRRAHIVEMCAFYVGRHQLEYVT
nr:MAG TPA: hypothetical protein [Caudoviricetes sp.]